jgi:Flp pilus assembly protein TadG
MMFGQVVFAVVAISLLAAMAGAIAAGVGFLGRRAMRS